MDGKMKKRLFTALTMGAIAFGLVIGGVNPLTELPYELIS
jgi:hypothetical protein